MTELRTRMRPPYNGDEAPTLSAVLVAGMRELAALEVDDLQDSNVNPSIKAREIVVEVELLVGWVPASSQCAGHVPDGLQDASCVPYEGSCDGCASNGPHFCSPTPQ
mmetsp:Transcript_38358/g.120777  ORF Transcript_38358/g.120777 Transcript_38358/m.120777 type:complete len:107 (-) Transcript_38358:568-888(-)